MAGRGWGSLLAAAIALGCCAPTAMAADESLRLVMVEHSPAMIESLEGKGFDVGFIGEKSEAAVYLDEAGEARLRAEGYRIGETLEDAGEWEARRAAIAYTKEQEALAGQVAKSGLTGAAKAKGAVNVPGQVVVMRAYTFTNYAGRFLYVEAHNKAHTDTTGPTMSFTYTGPNGTSQAFNLSNSTISPDGTDAAIGGNKLSDGDAGAGSRYMYHRGLVALRGADATLAANEVSVRVADATGAFDTGSVTEWTGKALPPRVAAFQKDFITKYMDPTESYGRLDALSAEFPSIMEAIDLPNKTAGYQRPAMAMMAGTTAANGTPSTATAPGAVYLRSVAMGHLGGNNITAEFKAPPAGTLNAPLSITVTDGTWRTHDPSDTDASDGIAETTIATKDIVVTLATNETGAVSTTSAQLVAAINADPVASGLVTATTYGANAAAGTGIVAATPSRTYQVPEGTTNTPSFQSTKVKLSDYLRGGTVFWTGNATATPSTLVRTDARHVQKGQFQPKVYRIGKDRSNSAVGVFLYCQQHAREWVTPITCVETAERLVRNYATDPTTKEYVDKLNVFIIPSVNPDGGHASFYDNAGQRKNLTNYCTPTTSNFYVGGRNSWGVDLNRNNSVGSRLDGYSGADSACNSEVFSGLSENSEPEIRNEQWVTATFPKIKFANNIHTHGGYFMWAPGAYKSAGRVTLPAPNIGIEKYFFDVADTILSHIKSSRGTALLPQRVGPIADTLYSAAGNSSDEGWYNRGIVGYSFEAGAQRITVNQTTGAITRTSVGFQPCFKDALPPAGFSSTSCGTPANPNPLLANEGHDSTMEFAEGNYGMIQGALEFSEDVTAPQTTIEYSSSQTPGEPINYRFNWVSEPAVIYYTTDGATPAKVDCDAPTGSTRCYNNQGPRRPGEILTVGLGAHTIKWFSEDMKGNREAVKSQRLLVAADDADGGVTGTVPATLALSLGTAAKFEPFLPAVPKDYTASTTAQVTSTAGDATLSVNDGGANPGHLMNGTFKLPQPMQASASSMGAAAAPAGAIGATARTLLSYSGPVSNDSVTLTLKQSIGGTDALRTGTYGKTLTYTLSTTTP